MCMCTVNGMKGLWVVRPLIFFIRVRRYYKGENKNRGDYVNFCFGYTWFVKMILRIVGIYVYTSLVTK